MNKLRARILLFATLVVFSLSVHYCSRAEAQEKKYSWLDKIDEAKQMLKNVELKHSVKIVTYKETRKLPAQVKKKKSKILTTKRTDYAWKEAGLVLMNTETGEIKLIKIRKEGQKLFNLDKEFTVEIEPRVNGITWNGRNTAFRVVAPDGWIVIANGWIDLVSGKPAERIYFPYSTSLHQDELIKMGDFHLEGHFVAAVAELHSLGVISLANSDKKVSETMSFLFPINLVLVELTDPQEFYAFKSGTLKFNPFDRVKILLAGNGEGAFSTYNYAGAVGLTQFTRGTWNIIKKKYPLAKLPEFNVGAMQHIESIMAAILLYDYNLNELKKVFGEKILDDEKLDHYLYAAHNCGIGRVIKAIKRTKTGQDWRVALRKLGKTDETIIFLEKVDYLLKSRY
ncbi:MAG: hypothetical protein HYT61_03030 [Candidatus Yanofskybacteria bacterium]|nr:hypothetical protein [Candidatus Yanofskybacteria bacterium]